MLLEGIGFVRHIDTLHYVLPYLDDNDLNQSACKAVVELAHSRMLREPNKAEFDKDRKPAPRRPDPAGPAGRPRLASRQAPGSRPAHSGCGSFNPRHARRRNQTA